MRQEEAKGQVCKWLQEGGLHSRVMGSPQRIFKSGKIRKGLGRF